LFAEGVREHEADGVRWLFPDLGPSASTPLVGGDRAPPVRIQQARREAERLALCAREARARMARPFCATATAAAHEALLEAQQSALHDEPERSNVGVVGAAPAMAVGTVVHGVLERIDLRGDLAEAVARQRDGLVEELRSLVSPDALAEALAAAQVLVDGLAGSRLLRRLQLLAEADCIVARELPVLLAGDEQEGPVGATIGVIDLLYRDPDEGTLVVADYKSDRVGGTLLRERALAYARQGGVYLEAVRRALGVEPRFELWFLHADEIVVC
jgi:ATP-dependent exoDNAse (exonuclease V) beta subunit